MEQQQISAKKTESIGEGEASQCGACQGSA